MVIYLFTVAVYRPIFIAFLFRYFSRYIFWCVVGMFTNTNLIDTSLSNSKQPFYSNDRQNYSDSKRILLNFSELLTKKYIFCNIKNLILKLKTKELSLKQIKSRFENL